MEVTIGDNMTAFEQLKQKLHEIFQLDKRELDFGIYRIMNLKADEIASFIDNDLLTQVKSELESYTANDNKDIKNQLAKAMDDAKNLGIDPEASPKVKELKAKLSQAFDAEKTEIEIYSDLYNFFKRYYSEGDFLSLRRYKEGVYALPYEGEEVKLYWANADQYYIKSSETLTNYTFKAGPHKIRFEVADATTEQNNNKAKEERRFKLLETNPVRQENGEYIVSFSYLPDSTKTKQEELNKQTEQALLQNSVLAPCLADLRAERGTGKAKSTLLGKHLDDFTAKNTFDYFIHKNLGKFLRRELDFYIKNEMMHLDDIETENAPRVEQYLAKIKVFRKIAGKIITFLVSLEDFQKKLWLKKKFVLETNYCITLDRVPEELYEEIAKNDTQREEWIKLFAINEIEQDTTHVGYSAPLTTQFLKENPFLVLDTAFFSTEFKYKLLASIDDLDRNCDGLLIHSENFQALNLLQEKYREKVQCIYIDPPYNTELDRQKGKFIYKDGYPESSWLSLMFDRLVLGRNYLEKGGVVFVSIDDHEHSRLKNLCDSILGYENFISSFVWQKKSGGGQAKYFYEGHEYILIYSKNKSHLIPFLKDKEMSLDIHKILNENGKYYYMEDDFLRKVHGKYTGGDERRCHYEDILEFKGMEKKEEIDKGIKSGQYDLFLDAKTGKHFVRRKTEIFKINDKYYKKVLPYSMIQGIWNSDGTDTLDNILGRHLFDNPKPVDLVKELVNFLGNKKICVFDFFAGSGSTGHAVLNLNHVDASDRNYILCEMGTYFDTVTKPRIEKVIYSEDWKDGKPISRKGSSHCFKYIRLESYEDALDNLSFERTDAQKQLFAENKSIQEEYTLKYMMDLETKDSLLTVHDFNHPFDYSLNITRNGETKRVNVDLVETFNYLIGLEVHNIQESRGVVSVEGVTRKGEKVLILWRDVTKTDNEALNTWFEKRAYSTQDHEFDVIYVNGDNNLENLRKEDETWKVRLTEAEFLKRMFDVQEA